MGIFVSLRRDPEVKRTSHDGPAPFRRPTKMARLLFEGKFEGRLMEIQRAVARVGPNFAQI